MAYKAKSRVAFNVLEGVDNNRHESEPYQLNELTEMWIDLSQYCMHNDNDLIRRDDIAWVSIHEAVIIEEKEKAICVSTIDFEIEDYDSSSSNEDTSNNEELNDDDWL